MVQIIPGVGEQLGGAINDFAKGLESFMKPNLEFQKAMQKAVGGNPQLAQQLTDLEANAPGTLQRMGFGALGDAIKSIPESPESQFKRQNRGEIIGAQKGQLDLATTQQGFDLGRLNDTIDFLKDPANKAVKADEILKRLTGHTAAGGQLEQTQAAAAAAELPAVQAEADTRVAKAGVARQAFDKAMADLPDLANTDLLRTARDFIAGRADGATVSALFNTPGANEAFSKAIQAVEEERQIALRENLAAMHGKADQKDMLLTREAFSRYEATKGAGTLEAWKTILTDPQRVEEIKAKAPKDLTQEDRDILHADQAQTDMQMDQQRKQVQGLNQAINDAKTKLETAVKQGQGQAGVNVNINTLNAALAQKALITGKSVIAKYGPKPTVGKNDPHAWNFEGSGLYFVDAKGNRVGDDQILDEPDPTSGQTNQDAMRAAMTLQGMPLQQRTAELEKMKSQRPDVYKLVLPLMK